MEYVWVCAIPGCRQRSSLYRFHYYLNIVQHMIIHHLKTANFFGKCEFCEWRHKFSKPFLNSGEIIKHLIDQHAHKKCRCYACKEIFIDIIQFEEHLKLENEYFRDKKCLICGANVESPCLFETHNNRQCTIHIAQQRRQSAQ